MQFVNKISKLPIFIIIVKIGTIIRFPINDTNDTFSKLYISITLTTPEHIHEINKEYRNDANMLNGVNKIIEDIKQQY